MKGDRVRIMDVFNQHGVKVEKPVANGSIEEITITDEDNAGRVISIRLDTDYVIKLHSEKCDACISKKMLKRMTGDRGE